MKRLHTHPHRNYKRIVIHRSAQLKLMLSLLPLILLNSFGVRFGVHFGTHERGHGTDGRWSLRSLGVGKRAEGDFGKATRRGSESGLKRPIPVQKLPKV